MKGLTSIVGAFVFVVGDRVAFAVVKGFAVDTVNGFVTTGLAAEAFVVEGFVVDSFTVDGFVTIGLVDVRFAATIFKVVGLASLLFMRVAFHLLSHNSTILDVNSFDICPVCITNQGCLLWMCSFVQPY